VTDDVRTDYGQLPANGGAPLGEGAAGAREGRPRQVLLGAIPFVIGLGLWELLGRLNLESFRYVIPTPEGVILALLADLKSGQLGAHLWITMQEVFAGLGIAIVSAVVLGGLIGRSRLLEQAFYPSIVFFQALPKVALAPLWLIAFGFGLGSKIALAAMIGFFPLLMGVIVGMGAIRREEIELMRSLKASEWQIFTKVQVPRAFPSFFGGLEVGAVFALIGAVVGEFVGAQGGLGYLIDFRSSRLDLPGIFSALVVLAMIGVIFDLGFRALGRKLMHWEGE
jgi:NitT/TauT family transport system permease protein